MLFIKKGVEYRNSIIRIWMVSTRLFLSSKQ